MRAHLLLLFCLACLAFTAQAAPASARSALLAQKLKQRSTYKSKRHQRHHDGNSQDAGPKEKRATPERVIEEAAARLAAERSAPMPVADIEADLHAKYTDLEQRLRQQATRKHQAMETEDALHVAKYGQNPTKFPAITRWSARIGLAATVFNVANIIFAAKTTALATTQFSAPPTPPTLIDTAARWNGTKNVPMSLPEDKEPVVVSRQKSDLRKRSLETTAAPVDHKRMIKRRKVEDSDQANSDKAEADDTKMAKRWIIASIVGAAAGAAMAPGVPSTIVGWKNEVDKPPFDPYDPNILKQQDPLAAAAAHPDQPLPAARLPQSVNGDPSYRPLLQNVKFPASAYAVYSTVNDYPQLNSVQPQTQTEPAAHNNGASTSAAAQPVLRKRSVVAGPDSDASLDHAGADLHKRFFFGSGPWGKVSGAVALGSILPLLYGGVTHARYRQMNPRDRDILKDLDNTPTYGAVGVPGRQPGQLATKAMPGYDQYMAGIQSEQSEALAQQQQQRWASLESNVQAAQQNQAQMQAQTAGSASVGGVAQTAEPVLRRRDTVGGVSRHVETHLEKRGKWLVGGALAVVGGLLGYVQSATQFPTDRDEEKDKRKHELKKQQEALAAQQTQMQGGQPGMTADPGAMPADPNAMGAGAAATGANSFASAPPQALDGSSGGYGSTGAYSSSYAPDTSNYNTGASYPSFSLASPGAGAGYSSTGVSSGAASLNAAAGYQASTAPTSGGAILKKRSPTDSSLETDLAKRGGIGKFFSIAGTTMFLGTLAGNIMMSNKQKNKPVPLVTPNADTKGPMVVGGDKYVEYLEWKRKQVGADGSQNVSEGDLLSGGAAPVDAVSGYPAAAIPANLGAGYVTSAATYGTSGYGQAQPGIAAKIGSNAGSSSYGSSDYGTPILKKRSPLFPGLIAGTGAADAEAAASSFANRAPMIAEAASGASAGMRSAGGLSQYAGEAGGLARSGATGLARGGASTSEAGLWRFGKGASSLGRSAVPRTGEGLFPAFGQFSKSTRPAMINGLPSNGLAGAPATIDAAAGASALSATSMSRGAGQIVPPRAAAGAAEEVNDEAMKEALSAMQQVRKKKGILTGTKPFDIIGSGAGASMTFNGIGRR